MQVTVARPRDSKSPNFKAFESIKTLDNSPTINYHGSNFSNRKGRFEHDPCGTAPEQSFFSDYRSVIGEKPHYKSLCNGNTETVNKILSTNHLDSSVKRFSQQMSPDDKSKTMLAALKKRLSAGSKDIVRSRFGQNK